MVKISIWFYEDLRCQAPSLRRCTHVSTQGACLRRCGETGSHSEQEHSDVLLDYMGLGEGATATARDGSGDGVAVAGMAVAGVAGVAQMSLQEGLRVA